MINTDTQDWKVFERTSPEFAKSILELQNTINTMRNNQITRYRILIGVGLGIILMAVFG